jgi:hypothetical protein
VHIPLHLTFIGLLRYWYANVVGIRVSALATTAFQIGIVGQ